MRSYARLIVLGGLVAGCAGEVPPPPTTFTIGDGSIRLEEDGSASLELTVETNAERFQYEIVDQPKLGQLIGTANTYDYVANDDVNGTDTFTWRAVAEDGTESDLATVTVFIEPINDGPTGTASQIQTDEDTPVSGQLPAEDVEGETLTFVLVSSPENGRVDLGTDGSYTYTPDRNFVGADSFLWSALDPAGATTGPVRVDINVGSLNDAPTVEAATFSLSEDTPFNGQLRGSDADGDSLNWSIVSQPTNGTLDFNAALGTFTYRPALNFFGTDSFDVTATDGVADSEVTTINLTIISVNDRPLVTAVTLATDEDSPLDSTITATDVENQDVSFRVDAAPRNGIVSLDSASGAFTYTPNPDFNGLDDFTVIANDGFNDSLAGRITISVAPVNDAPTLSSPGLVTTDEDVSAAGQVSGFDKEGDSLTYGVAVPPAFGNVTLSQSTGAFAYEPNLDFNGNDVFELNVSDGMATSASTVLTVVVLPVNDAPRVQPTQLTMVAGQTGTVSLQASDPEGEPLFFVVNEAPQFGDALLNSTTGEVSYTPDPGYTGPDLLRYRVSDGDLTTEGFLTINVSEDTDGDEIGDSLDNCPDVANPDQNDIDSNGRGDRCDCVTEAFGASFNSEFIADAQDASNVRGPVVSPAHALRLNGNGAYFETVAQPSCFNYGYAFDLATGNPAPEPGDELRLSVSVDGGAFEVVDTWFGTGQTETFTRVTGATSGIDVSGDVVFRLEVVSDEGDDLFIVDDFFLGCDSDSDLLADCVESFLPGYDLLQADADGDGLLDSEEFERGTDPNAPDTDFDNIDDPLDNCPLDFNPGQEDVDGNGFGDECDLSIIDTFDAGSLDPDVWDSSIPVVDAGVENVYPFRGTHSLRLSNGDGGVVTSLPIDFFQCPEVAWDFRLAESADGNSDYPCTNDRFFVEMADGEGGWVELYSKAGFCTFPGTLYYPVLGKTSSELMLREDAVVRFRASDTSFTTGDDDWYIDDIYVGCDTDGDMIPNSKELEVYGTDLFNADTDGDGVDDGDEVLAGTNPNARLLPIQEDFSTGVADSDTWEGASGDAEVSNLFGNGDGFSLRVGNAGGTFESKTFAFDECSGTVAWDVRVKTDLPPNEPAVTDILDIDVYDPLTDTWSNVETYTGGGPLDFDILIGSSTNPVFGQLTGAKVRINTQNTGSGASWFIDDIVVDCDDDNDLLPAWAEVNIYGTFPDRTDSDFDGVPDGQEILAGTDPLDGIVAGFDNEPNDTQADADANNTYNMGTGGQLVVSAADVLTTGDIDVYRLDTTGTATITATVFDGVQWACNGTPQIDSQIALYDSTFTQLAFNDNAGGNLVWCSEVTSSQPAGIYYVEVRPSVLFLGSPFDYSLTVDVIP